jgi:5'(3')-deoxyribonucleotidase
MKFNDFKIVEYGPHDRVAKVGDTTVRANTRTGKRSVNTKVGDLELDADNTLNKDGSQGRMSASYKTGNLKLKHDTRKGMSASHKNADGTTMSASNDGKGKTKFKVSEHGGRIVKGVNTTADVGTDEIKKQAAKFGNSVDKDGRPPTLSKKVKGKSTNVLFNLGLAEGNRQSNLIDFVNFCKDQLSLKSSPPIKFVSDTEDTTFGYFDNDTKGIVIQNTGRHQMDVMRTVAHELVHYKQDQAYDRELNGEDGSPDENQANALAGVILRRWGQKNPTLFTESVDADTQSSVYFTNMQEQLGEIASASEIYVDMDGVLADFFGEWTRLMNVDHWSKIDNDGLPQALQKIRDTDEFWLRLPILPQAKELLTLIKNIKGEYNICSSPLQDDPNSEPHKREWIKKNLSFFPPKNVYITHNKPQYAKNKDGTPNILIDDFGRNVKQWEDAGGIGFKYKDHKFERTAKQLQKHMTEPVKEAFDTKVDWEKDPEDQGDGEAYKANIGRKEVGIQYYFEPINAGDVIVPGLDITFEVNGTTKKTGGGDASTIFGAVINHIKQFIKQHSEIDAIQFSASKEQGLSRTRLYSAMVDKLSQGTGFVNAKTISKADKSIKNADMFKLVRRSAVNDKMVGIEENFADGKKKGKSRPGRVKRSGASCNGSVTELRKKAKKASGERAKMYHWCANMKSGRS